MSVWFEQRDGEQQEASKISEWTDHACSGRTSVDLWRWGGPKEFILALRCQTSFMKIPLLETLGCIFWSIFSHEKAKENVNQLISNLLGPVWMCCWKDVCNLA
jgi:hypothetical protein